MVRLHSRGNSIGREKPFLMANFLGDYIHTRLKTFESGNFVVQAAMAIPVATALFLASIQFGTAMAQATTLNSGIENAISACDFSEIGASEDKNLALADQIASIALLNDGANLSASNTQVIKSKNSVSVEATRDETAVFSVDQTTTKAHLTADLTYEIELFVNVFGMDSIELTRHVDAWQSVENDIRFTED